MKIFRIGGSTDTKNAVAEIILAFPEPVDYVALAGFTNDHHITYQFDLRGLMLMSGKPCYGAQVSRSDGFPQLKFLVFSRRILH